ncbi:hypothetical protein [uncultured Cocleimonas sp.]|uniref:hypothetical protein n=1 Tax=uncultured Cocleimonas sp. TaxID=1051587 RepID=UPI00260CB4BA|nr:hypothetical protein [uncultured Cocleimonas sp.]
MNKMLPVVALCSAAILTTILLNGCDKPASANAKAPQPHLSTFLSLHNQYCEKKYDTPESLQSSLDKAPELAPAKDFNGVYEVHVNGISFAVSPEEDGCTTDVMVQTSDKKELFSFEDINKALLSVGYVETGEPVSRKDLGTDQSELTIIEKKYISPKGEITTLDFPLEKKDKYYMTLFAEKFSEAKRETKERIIQSLKMASN